MKTGTFVGYFRETFKDLLLIIPGAHRPIGSIIGQLLTSSYLGLMLSSQI